MATSTLDILLNFQAKTDALSAAAAEVLKLSAANKAATAEARALADVEKQAQAAIETAARQQVVATQQALQAEIQRREIRVQQIQFERAQLQGSNDPARGTQTLALLEQERALVNEIAQLRIKSATTLPETERLRVLGEIQRTDQAIAREATRAQADLARDKLDAERAAQVAAQRAAEEQKRAAAEALQNAIRRRELELSAAQFERAQLQFTEGPGVDERRAALLERERQITADIVALKRQGLDRLPEAERLRVLGEIQRLEQGIARDTARSSADQRLAAQDRLRAERENQSLLSSFGGLARIAGVITGVQLSLQGLFATVRGGITSALQLAETFKNTGDRLQTTAEAAQVIDFAFRRGGLSITEATQAIFSLNKRLDEARGGSEAAARPFFALGLSLQQLADLPVERRLELVGQALRRNEGNAGALDAAVEILGNKSQRTFDVLKNYGTLGFDRLKEDAVALGQLIDPHLIEKLEKTKQRLEDFSRRKDSFFGDLAVGYVDIFDRLAGDDLQQAAAELSQTERGIARLQERIAELRREEWSWTDIFRIGQDTRIPELERQLERANEELEKHRAALERAAEARENFARTPDRPPPLNLERPPEFGRIQREAVALDPADATAARIAREKAELFLRNNQEKLEEQNRTLREAKLLDEERLILLGQRLRALDEERERGLAVAQSEAERTQINLQSENERLQLQQQYASTLDKIAQQGERDAAEARANEQERVRAAREAIDLEIQRREIILDAVAFERDQLQDDRRIGDVEREQRTTDLIARQRALLEEILALKRAALAATTEEAERLRAQADVQGTEQRIKVLDTATAGPVDFLEQIKLADTLRDGIDGVSRSLAEALVSGKSLRDGLSQVFRQIAVEIATATIRAVVFRSIMSAVPGLGSFLNLGGSIAGGGGSVATPGFAEGGLAGEPPPRFTGPGGKYDVAGVVHAGEFVHTKEEVEAAGGPEFFYTAAEFVRRAPKQALRQLEAYMQSSAPFSDRGLAAPEPRAKAGFADGGYAGTESFATHGIRLVDAGGLAAASGRSADIPRARASGDDRPPVHVTFNFEAGVTPAQLASLIPTIEDRVPGLVVDAMRRNRIG